MPFAKEEWTDFLERVLRVRSKLMCLKSNAWFRGHRDASWDLRPRVIRDYTANDIKPPFSGDIKTRIDISNHALNLLGVKKYEYLKISTAQRIALESLNRQANDAKKAIRANRLRHSELKFITAQRQLAQRRQPTSVDRAQLEILCHNSKLRMIPAGTANESLLSIIPSDIEGKALENRQYYLKLKDELASILIEIANVTATAFGEQDSFTEFRARLAIQTAGSWEILATMQHYGASTRLLDWTESLLVALSFALRSYLDLYEQSLLDNKGDFDKFLELCYQRSLVEPSVWVLNPFFLARHAGLGNEIPDLSLPPDLDYFQRFFMTRDWPHAAPVPMYGPRRDQRMNWQYATFTVHGTDLRPLEDQLGSDVVQEIKLSRDVAAYGARTIFTLAPLDKFALFRDPDSLGRSIASKYEAWSNVKVH